MACGYIYKYYTGWFSHMTSRRFVIPDIHGCALTFRALVENAIRLQPEDSLYLLGDYIDRGPRSRELLDTILDLRKHGFHVEALRGNHEEMLLNADDSLMNFRLWIINGGHATLDSFKVERAGEIPSRYLDFLKNLRYFIELEDFVLVHACLDFQNENPFSDRETMLWARYCDADISRIGNRRLITGHTPIPREALIKGIEAERILLDNGCVYKGAPGLGSLAALELNSMAIYFQENID
jgi:serine/threonine protein phosphatase 1